MKPPLSMILLVLAANALAQDVEPTPERAIRSLVQDLVSELPYRVPNGEALAIEAEAGSDKVVVDAFASALLAAGFRIQSGPAGATGHAVPIRVSTREAASLGSIRVVAGDLVAERSFGHAAWVDRAHDAATIIVLGGPRDSIEAAVSAARQKLDQELRTRFPRLAGDPDFERYASRQPTTTFVGKHDIAGRPHYEAYVMARPSFDHLQRAEKAVLRAERRMPWVKASVLAFSACVLWGLYVRADFRTRGWRTGRLRLLFGTLFAALSLGLWSLPL